MGVFLLYILKKNAHKKFYSIRLQQNFKYRYEKKYIHWKLFKTYRFEKEAINSQLRIFDFYVYWKENNR